MIKYPPAMQEMHRRYGFNPWVGNIWRKEWQPTPVFLLEESHGQRSLVGYSSDTTEQLSRYALNLKIDQGKLNSM